MAFGAFAAAAPASAQSWRAQPAAAHGQVRQEIRQEIGQLHQQIANAQQRGRISQREANGLRRQVAQLQNNYARFSRGGIDRREYAMLDGQIRQVRQNLRSERADLDRRRF
jgi:hypothetical protein